MLRSLNRELFSGDLRIELVILPPEEGTFLARLGVVVAVGAAAFTFIESDIGKAYFKGLTGHEPAHWAEAAGRSTRQAIDDIGAVEGDDIEAATEQEAKLICEATKAFLQKDNGELERAGITPARFRDAFAAKNEFYQACEATPSLRAIGFSAEPSFPIKRQDFPRFQVALPPEQDEIRRPWHVATVTLRVTSPNWNHADRTRAWKARDERGRDRYFYIEDLLFWLRVTEGAISAHVIDEMTVQWAFQGSPDQPKNCRVLRVLEFNGVQLAEPLADEDLEAELGRVVRVADASADQPDLFRN